MQKAICAATRDFISRPRECGSSPPFKALIGFTDDARSAGASPKRNVTATARAAPNSSARQSTVRMSRTGSSGGASIDATKGADHQENSAPSIEAAVASNALSTRSICTSRAFPAPIETRKAISRARAAV